MEQTLRCIYRKKKCFRLCNKKTIKNTSFCCYHIHSKKKHLCKIFYNIFEDKYALNLYDIYNLYKYIREDQVNDGDAFINILFIDLLKMIPITKLSNIYENYIDDDTFKYTNRKNIIYNKIYLLNYKTYLFSNKCNKHILKYFQNVVKYKLLCIQDSSNCNFLNEEDLFTTENINNIDADMLFTIKDIKGTYAFNIVELEYFVRKCLNDNVSPYNPYTREALRDKTIWRLNMKMNYHNIAKKMDECLWTTEMNAFTDLSIEIERRGFYNNPEWFKKMSRNDFFKCIKLFRDFSSEIEESKIYFLNINDDTFTYDFCKESIKMFNECKDDLYILCCNYMKSIALCSNDFYSNLPEWLSIYETPSYILSISNLTSLISTLINNNISDNDVNNNNNLTDIRNTRSNIMDINYNMNIDNMNIDNINSVQPATIISPSNNFLLYYYVEYM